jgi:3'-phosphoadenosine 5'-phosphosulfate sulfotransferase (PAPS reductase)/FAD synthetase
MIVGWFSGGITSALACYLGKPDKLIFCETGSHHPDTARFIKDCEAWLGAPVEILQSKLYSDHFDVIEKRRFINGPAGALCTYELKRRVREDWQRNNPGHHTYIWGFDVSEPHRVERIKKTLPDYDHVFPLIDHGITKQRAVEIVQQHGITLPEMYRLGFHNNNCVGCVKGGMAYWNKIREHFPDVFDRMAKAERDIGRSCLRKHYLDELPPDAGRHAPPLVQDCGSVGEWCETQRSRDYYGRE